MKKIVFLQQVKGKQVHFFETKSTFVVRFKPLKNKSNVCTRGGNGPPKGTLIFFAVTRIQQILNDKTRTCICIRLKRAELHWRPLQCEPNGICEATQQPPANKTIQIKVK